MRMSMMRAHPMLIPLQSLHYLFHTDFQTDQLPQDLPAWVCASRKGAVPKNQVPHEAHGVLLDPQGGNHVGFCCARKNLRHPAHLSTGRRKSIRFLANPRANARAATVLIERHPTCAWCVQYFGRPLTMSFAEDSCPKFGKISPSAIATFLGAASNRQNSRLVWRILRTPN